MSSSNPTAYRRLAHAVLKQAFREARATHPRTKREAVAFLTGRTDSLNFWCALAGLDATVIRTAVICGLDERVLKTSDIQRAKLSRQADPLTGFE